jgi:quercetin dioxygenase-like cupin family protein
MEMTNRRDLLASLAAFAAMSGTLLKAQTPTASKDPVLSQSKGYAFDKMPVNHQPNGYETRTILHGVLPTGETVDLHETSLPAGQIPHPPHRHVHSEFTLVREGTLEFYNDGKPEIVGSGGVIFAASGVLHGWKNIGTTPATYFVFAVGAEPKA